LSSVVQFTARCARLLARRASCSPVRDRLRLWGCYNRCSEGRSQRINKALRPPAPVRSPTRARLDRLSCRRKALLTRSGFNEPPGDTPPATRRRPRLGPARLPGSLFFRSDDRQARAPPLPAALVGRGRPLLHREGQRAGPRRAWLSRLKGIFCDLGHNPID
jgi:hypothetical protein